jgi:hypothetical protein
MRKLPALLLAALAGGSTLLTAGCYYDRPNPWDTSDDVEELEDKRVADLQRELQEPWHPPQHEPQPLALPDLEAWRDTVLASADASTLTHIRSWTIYKLQAIEKRIQDLLRQDELNRREQLRESYFQFRTEKLRLQMVEARQAEARR